MMNNKLTKKLISFSRHFNLENHTVDKAVRMLSDYYLLGYEKFIAQYPNLQTYGKWEN